MSIATVVTRGFGSWGTKSLVVTRGYSQAGTPPPGSGVTPILGGSVGTAPGYILGQ